MKIPDFDFNSLTPESTIFILLRTLFATGIEYAVYIPDSGDAIIIDHGQIVSMVERNCGDTMIKRLPQLAERNIFTPVDINKLDYENLEAIYIRSTGTFLNKLELALSPDEPQYPEWWNAPVPFAMSARGMLKLNDKAIELFGTGLEQMNAADLPGRDEFIVKLEGSNGERFIAFNILRPGIFAINDCTEDVTDAQDLTWWAAVGQAWVKEIESAGGKWQRLSQPPEGNKKNWRACEWRGELQGYLKIEMPPRKKSAQKISPPPEVKVQEQEQEQKKIPEPEVLKPETKEGDGVIDSIGAQAMGLLAAGQTRGDFLM